MDITDRDSEQTQVNFLFNQLKYTDDVIDIKIRSVFREKN
jgi:hypothetical protein